MTRFTRARRALVASGAALLLAAASFAAAAPASAANIPEVSDPLKPENRIGDLTVTAPATRTLANSGDPTALTATTGCPEHFRASSRTFLVWSDGTHAEYFAATSRTAIIAGYGLDGTALNLTGSQAARFGDLNTANLLRDGTADLVVTCDPGDTLTTNLPLVSTLPIGDAKYFSVKLNIDKTNNTWSVADTRTATTTSLVSSAVTQTGVTLTATVAPSEATGTVQFKQAGTAIGDPVTVSGGIASYAVSGLTAGTSYAFTAEYSGDTTHTASSGSVDVTTEAVPVQDTATPTVGVTVPTATTPTPTGLKMSAKPSAVTLEGPTTRTAGEVWIATGELGTVTVNDDRQSAGTPWTLNGRISKLTSGSNEIAASNVGWKPAKVGDGNGTAGAEVAASVDGGLGSDKPLATGTGSATANVTTSVGATITLNTPADAPAGDYTATLTLTLI